MTVEQSYGSAHSAAVRAHGVITVLVRRLIVGDLQWRNVIELYVQLDNQRLQILAFNYASLMSVGPTLFLS